MKKTLIATSALAALLLASQANAARIPVTACGTVVQGRGELLGDLDCSAYSGSAVILEGNSSLRMNGFTLSANTSMQDVEQAAVFCVTQDTSKRHTCKVMGPGTITGGTAGISGNLRTMVSDMTITGAGTVGVLGGARTVIRRSVIQGNGATAERFEGGGVYGAHVSLRNSDVSGNAEYGVFNHQRIRLHDSSVTGNGTAPLCAVAPYPCADLLTREFPFMVRSTCGTSKRYAPGYPTLGACSND